MAQARASGCSLVVVLMVRVAILRPRSSTATIVCERLCASIPNVIMGMAFPDRETGEVHGPAVVSRRAALRTIAMTAGNKVERTRRNNSTLPLGKRCKWCSLLVECRHGLSEALTRPPQEHGNCDQPRVQLSSATCRGAVIEPRSRGNPVSYLMWRPRILTGSPGSAGEDSQRKWRWYEEHHQVHSGVARECNMLAAPMTEASADHGTSTASCGENGEFTDA